MKPHTTKKTFITFATEGLFTINPFTLGWRRYKDNMYYINLNAVNIEKIAAVPIKQTS